MNLNQPASGQYDEWLGTATADDWTPNKDIYKILDIDHKEWSIMGFELSPGGFLTVYAFRESDLPVDYSGDHERRHDEWLAAIRANGFLPIHQIHVSNPDVLDQVFKRFTVRLFTNTLVKHDLPVQSVGEIYAGEDG